jgi:hypothetical protein
LILAKINMRDMLDRYNEFTILIQLEALFALLNHENSHIFPESHEDQLGLAMIEHGYRHLPKIVPEKELVASN